MKISFFIIFLIIPSVLATDYYVDDDASGGSGTFADPWGSVSDGLDALAAGDTLFLREGTYSEPLSTPTDGTVSQPITVQAYSGESVIFEISQRMTVNGDYWIFDGLTVDGLDVAEDLFRIDGDHITFRNCDVHSRELDLFDVSGDYFTIHDCNVHDTYWYDSSDAHCLVFNQHADYANVSYNNIYNCDGDGIQFFARDDDNPQTDYSLYAWIAYNNFYADPDYPVPPPDTVVENAIDLKGLSNATIKGNVMYGFPNMKAFVAQKGVSYLVVEENVLYDSFAGFEFRGEDGWTQEGHKIYRNIIYDVGDYCLKFDGVFTSEVYHNVMDNCGGRAVRMEGGNLIDSFYHNNIAFRSGTPSSNDESTIKSHNGWFDTDDGGLGGDNDVVGSDPGFVDADGHDYTLRPDSVAIDAGLDVGLVFGGSAPDLGAFEIISNSCGNGNIDVDEECDDGIDNGVVCTAGYGDTCQYCSFGCTVVTVQGPYCGDSVCSDGETPYTCSVDCGTIAQLPLVATFESDEEEFSYTDDAFGTNEASRADGQWGSSDCFAGGCLQVGLNLASPASAGPYSGGWSRQFEVTEESVEVSFWYQLRLAEPTEIGEVASIMLNIDGSDVHVISLEHDNPGQDSYTSGFFTQDFSLDEGLHEFTAGCHLTSVSSSSENAECWIDEVRIQASSANDPDFNNDGAVNVEDFVLLQNEYETNTATFDLSGDGYISLVDIALFGSFFEVSAFCGDGSITSGEVCDDGNQNSGDGCASCQIEDGWVCSGEPTSCTTPTIGFEEVASGLQEPVSITHAQDDRLFVVEQDGKIKILDGSVLPTPFLDISSKISMGGERGLLGLAFHPSYETNGLFYVYYTDTSSDTVVAEYSVSSDPNVADANSERILLQVEQPHNNHNGGQLQFGLDGYLYIGLGDGGSQGDPYGHGQNTSTLLGSILRIDVDASDAGEYGIPPTNPFIGTGLDEIFAYGFRNPWRFSFDNTGRLFVGDVGQNDWEEVNLVLNGGNYGWNIMEGSTCYTPDCDQAGLILPVAEYSHDLGCSVTGGYVYSGSVAALDEVYVYADYCSGRVWGLFEVVAGVWGSSELLDTSYFVSTFGEDSAGELYVADFSGGSVYKLI